MRARTGDRGFVMVRMIPDLFCPPGPIKKGGPLTQIARATCIQGLRMREHCRFRIHIFVF